jgi:hypothetical protein
VHFSQVCAMSRNTLFQKTRVGCTCIYKDQNTLVTGRSVAEPENLRFISREPGAYNQIVVHHLDVDSTFQSDVASTRSRFF